MKIFAIACTTEGKKINRNNKFFRAKEIARGMKTTNVKHKPLKNFFAEKKTSLYKTGIKLKLVFASFKKRKDKPFFQILMEKMLQKIQGSSKLFSPFFWIN